MATGMNYTLPPIYKLIVKSLLPKDTITILDLGCGMGIVGEALNNNGDFHLVGVDIYEPYLKVCKKRGFYKKLIKRDLRKIDFKEKSFDVVTLFQVIEHLNKNESKKLIKKAMHIAKKAVIVSVPNGHCHQEAYDGNLYHQHQSTWRVSDLKSMNFQVFGQGLKLIYGSEGYGSKRERGYLQKIGAPISFLLSPLTLIYPNVAVQLIGVKYLKMRYK